MTKNGPGIVRIVIVAIAVGYGLWIFIGLIKSNSSNSVQDSKAYTVTDLDSYREQCRQSLSIRDSYPEITRAFCDCYVEEVVKKYTKDQLMEIGMHTKKERDSLLNDIITRCAKATGRDTVEGKAR